MVMMPFSFMHFIGLYSLMYSVSLTCGGGQNSLIVLAKDVLMPFCCVLICILVHRLILKILPSKFYKLLGDR